MIEEAGFADYAKLGSDMNAAGRVRLVSPPSLGENFNAYAFINTREIWINRPMFARYPTVVEQANGPWWSAQSEFYQYWTASETASLAGLTDEASIGVAR